jgi:Flp pilus assembly protein TadG
VTVRETPATACRRHKGHFERGAAAVEMALVLPVLLFLLMAMIDFGRAYNAQIQLSAAAREGVRLASLNPGLTTSLQTSNGDYGDAAIAGRATSAAGGLGTFATASDCSTAPTATTSYACISYCPLPASTTATATVVLRANFTWITGISGMARFFGSGVFPTPTTIRAKGVMRCAG